MNEEQGYSYIYDESKIIFISQFLDDMTHKVNKLKLARTRHDLLDIITDYIVDKFYDIEDDELEDLVEYELKNVSPSEAYHAYKIYIFYAVRRSIKSQFENFLYSNFMEYMDLIEEEDKKPEYSEGFKHVRNRVYQDLLEVFFVRNS